MATWRTPVLLSSVSASLLGIVAAAPATRDAAAPPTVSPSAPARSVAVSVPGAPSADSLRAAIERQLSNTPAAAISQAAWHRTRALYAAAGGAPMWTTPGDRLLSPRAAALLQALSDAHAHGLRRSDYGLQGLADALAAVERSDAGDDARARADVALTASLVAYATDMLTGRLRPSEIESAWHIETRAVDVDSALQRTLRAPDLPAALARLVPSDDGYATLVGALGRYRGIAAAGGWPLVPEGPTLRPGASTPHLAALRARLTAEGYLSRGGAVGAGESTAVNPVLRTGAENGTYVGTYGGGLAVAVAHFQARHGLAVDSVVGPRTRAALNVPAERRARQVAANLERYRWLPPAMGERYVVVNVPAFRLDAYEGERRMLSMRVVVGSELASRRTPIFSDSMSYVQFGPFWNVPRSIAVNEILPSARRDRGYLARNGYEIVRGWGDGAPVVDPWELSDGALFSSRYRVRQRPGPSNALGRVKFMFPNEYAVYLHDTPAQALFDRRERAYSHGCVRVADPAALARFVLAERAGWTAERIDETLREGRRVRVSLPAKIPVYLIYLTAFDEGGEVAFRDDLYDHDTTLIDALGEEAEAPGTSAVVGRLARLADRLSEG
ncbi:L,D-transpeptidase family protein [Roseisolibacter sp. H3M3-2]|uniref:L,D-transpeptidase family protein n=1 Tax=Roseisolibacter sp. H3M3-2 TaxID=3031323 RepID=UPI0023D991C2|nr:L,D-transpeptidase family protein [Roseisolibacter sp. H3M3-2]MDF1501338.1 L,D-transpeptidase family protein [Roseisolibacter sp. H3M3-2]